MTEVSKSNCINLFCNDNSLFECCYQANGHLFFQPKSSSINFESEVDPAMVEPGQAASP